VYGIDNLREDTKIGFLFQDTDNLRNKQSIRFELNIQKDQPPIVTARLDGIGNAITPNAVLPTVGEITDDNGIANAIYRYKIYHQQNNENENKNEIENANENKITRNNFRNSDQLYASHHEFRQNKNVNANIQIDQQELPTEKLSDRNFKMSSFFVRFDLDGQTNQDKNQKVIYKSQKTEPVNAVNIAIDKIDETAESAETDQTDKVTEGTTVISGIGSVQTLFALNTEFNVAKLQLRSGDKLSLQIEAMDKFDLDLPQTFQLGLGPVWELEIVTAEKLRLMLEAREISLRQRFEALISEVEVTRRLLDAENYSLMPPDSLVKEVNEMKISDDTLEEEKTQKQIELDVKKKTLLDTISKEQAVLGQYNISRALRDTKKEVYEFRTLVDSFRTIRREMVNNKIFNSESESRIDGGIISPIMLLVDHDFPDLDRLISVFDKTLAVRDKPLRQDAINKRKIVLDQIDSILKKMGNIRDNMVSMESYNEVIDILREILKEQKQIQNETEELRNKQIRELLLKD
jgi:hypothetical protein